MKLKRRTAIVTGGGRGIGRAVALALAKEGANVVVSARTQSEIEVVAREVQNLGAQSLAIAADATRIGDVEQLAKRTVAEFGSIDILVNNAGGAGREQDDVPGAGSRYATADLGDLRGSLGQHVQDQPEERLPGHQSCNALHGRTRVRRRDQHCLAEGPGTLWHRRGRLQRSQTGGHRLD
jgi:NAD(P)-dependent dehydrogenase (short-subunit alcohol dehydrogenase family)